MQEVALAMLSDSDSKHDSEDDLDSESEGNSDSDYYNSLGTLALAHDAISGSRYLDRGAGGCSVPTATTGLLFGLQLQIASSLQK